MVLVQPAGSRVRFRVLRMAFLLAIVTYLDRVCISVAAPYIIEELGITLLQMGTAFSAFTLAYSLFEVPSGWLGDRIGARHVLTRIVLWWSAFTMLTGLVRGFQSLVAVRFLFGAGEAGAFPNVMRSFATWFPAPERGKASGVVFLGTRLGGALAAPLVLVLIQWWGWRACFLAFGVLGVAWAWAWQRSYRDRPEDHPDIDAIELAQITEGRAASARTPPTPWLALLSSGNLYAICAMYFGYAYGLYFYFTWLPTYLVRELGFSMIGSGFFASLPFLLAGLANVAGGWCTDRLARTHGLRHARVTLGSLSFATSAALIVASLTVHESVAKALLLAVALASADFALSACWAVCLDIGAEHAGVITACMNSVGNLGGLAGPIVVGFMVDRWHSWTMPLYVTAAVYVFGALAWLAVDPRRRIDTTRAEGSSFAG
ncbi:MAG TPA: MFS transporter [Vicinamibacterales bacterium]|jgi:MFS family permease